MAALSPQYRRSQEADGCLPSMDPGNVWRKKKFSARQMAERSCCTDGSGINIDNLSPLTSGDGWEINPSLRRSETRDSREKHVLDALWSNPDDLAYDPRYPKSTKLLGKQCVLLYLSSAFYSMFHVIFLAMITSTTSLHSQAHSILGLTKKKNQTHGVIWVVVYYWKKFQSF